jgi:P22 coat protein - gene protein 5
MANDLTAVAGKIVARGMINLRSQAAMLRAVTIDYQDEVKSEGATIDVPIPVVMTASAVSPGPTPITPSNITAKTKPIALSNWNHASFSMTDKEMGEVVARAGFFPMQAGEAIEALARGINADLFALYYKVYNAVGVAGTAPFPIGSGNFPTPVAEPADLARFINDNKGPLSQRRLVIDTVAYAAAQKHPDLNRFDVTGDMGPKIEGLIGRKYGFDWLFDQQVPRHTAGTITTGLIAKASTVVAVGAKTLVATTAASTGAAALKKGDLIAIAGQTQPTFAIQADATQASASSDVTLTIEPGLDTALAGSEAITRPALGNTHRVNLGFHRSAFAYVTRPVSSNIFTGGNILINQPDPETGLTLTLEISRQNKQTVWDFSVLYGVGDLRNELAVRLVA